MPKISIIDTIDIIKYQNIPKFSILQKQENKGTTYVVGQVLEMVRNQLEVPAKFYPNILGSKALFSAPLSPNMNAPSFGNYIFQRPELRQLSR